MAWITHPLLKKFLTNLSARVTFQLEPQPLDIQFTSTWHSKRRSLLHCSLTGTASNWYDRLPQVYKMVGFFPPNLQITILISKTSFDAQRDALSLVKKIMRMLDCKKWNYC